MRSVSAVLVSLLMLVAACSRPEPPAATASPGPGSKDPSRPLPSPLPEVVARVDGRPILFAHIVPMARREMDAEEEAETEVEAEVVRNRAVRRALERYIDRELLFQEARSRGISADQRALDWACDQARAAHPDDEAWAAFLAEEGLDPQSFRTEMRVQHTVSALLAAETAGMAIDDDEGRRAYESDPQAFVPPGQSPPPYDAVGDEVKTVLRQRQLDEVTRRLLEALRAGAKIETFL
jgi:hypothetical protein